MTPGSRSLLHQEPLDLRERKGEVDMGKGTLGTFYTLCPRIRGTDGMFRSRSAAQAQLKAPERSARAVRARLGA